MRSPEDIYAILELTELYTRQESPVHKFFRLKSVAERCKRCALKNQRTQVVFGYGNIASRVMVIGEAPGGNEDIFGKPFIGKAGERFSGILEELGVDRDRDFYITNVLKCRPPKNRDPVPEEIKACEFYLINQIKIIKPLLFLALGRYSAAWLLGYQTLPPMRELRGRILVSKFKVPLIITYHPSAIDHARAKDKKDILLAAFRKDLEFFAEKLREIRGI